MDELEYIRQKKLAELRKKLEEQKVEKPEEQQKVNALAQLESIVMEHLTAEAKQRLFNIKMAHPDKYVIALQVLYQIISRYGQKIDDETLKKLLAKVFSKTRRETKIKFV